MPRKLNMLKNMKIDEISLVTAPACPDADVIFTKQAEIDEALEKDVSDEPRDDRGRWTTWGAKDLVQGSKGAARGLVRALSDRAKAIGETVVGRTVSAVRTTRPNGAYPVKGGGVQFDFEHTLNRVTGSKYHSSVQIRPEHVAGDSGTHRALQRGLAVTEKILRTSNRAEKEPFSSSKRFSFLSGKYENGQASTGLFGGAFSGGSSSTPSASSIPLSTETGGVNRTTQSGMPIYEHFSTEPRWSSQIRGRIPSGQPPFADSSFERAGGKAYYHNGRFVPQQRPDIQRGIQEVNSWLAANPHKVSEAMNGPRSSGTANGKHFFTPEGDYVPPGNRLHQDMIVAAYRDERSRVAANSGPSAVKRLFTTPAGEPATEYPADLSAHSLTHIWELKERAERLGHRDEMQRLDAEISQRSQHESPGTAFGGFRAEERFDKRFQTGGFDTALFGGTSTKSRGSRLDYAQRLAKSKIKR